MCGVWSVLMHDMQQVPKSLHTLFPLPLCKPSLPSPVAAFLHPQLKSSVHPWGGCVDANWLYKAFTARWGTPASTSKPLLVMGTCRQNWSVCSLSQMEGAGILVLERFSSSVKGNYSAICFLNLFLDIYLMFNTGQTTLHL